MNRESYIIESFKIGPILEMMGLLLEIPIYSRKGFYEGGALFLEKKGVRPLPRLAPKRGLGEKYPRRGPCANGAKDPKNGPR